MIDLKAISKGIERGEFPSGGTLGRCKTCGEDAYQILKGAYFHFLMLNKANERQSKSTKKFIQTFSRKIDYTKDRDFIYLVVLRITTNILPDVVRVVSYKIKADKRSHFFVKVVSLLVGTANPNVKVIEDQIRYAFQEIKDENEQRGFIDFLNTILKPSDFIKAMIFCRDLIGNKNYLELCVWTTLRNSDFVTKSGVEDLLVILPRLKFETIQDISIISDLSKHLRSIQIEISKTNELIKAMEQNIRKQLIRLNGELKVEAVENIDDLTGFYTNYQYGVK